MAPHRPLQTYTRSNSSVCYGKRYVALQRSEDVFNSLLAKNLTQRRVIQHKRKKIQVKELSLNKSTQLTNDSLVIDLEDTFDKIAKNQVVNPVPLKRYPIRNTSSESEHSAISQSEVAHVQIKIRTPVKKKGRRKKKKLVLPENVSTNLKNDISEVRKETTLDKSISVSLIVEKDNGKLDYRTLSYIRIPEMTGQARKTELQISVESQDKSYNFLHVPFKDVPVSSTPLVPRQPKKVVTHSSPNLIQTSLDEIMKWDYSLPSAIIPEPENKPKISTHRHHTRSSKKLNFPGESSEISDLKGLTNAAISVQDKESSLRNSKGSSKSTKKLSSRNIEVNECKVVLDQMNLSQIDSIKSAKRSLSDCEFVDCKQDTHEYVDINGSEKGNSADLSCSSSASSSRSRYKTRDSVYITLRKRRVYSKSFQFRSKTSHVPMIVDEPSSIEEQVDKQNSINCVSMRSINTSKGHFSNSDIIELTPESTTDKKANKRFTKSANDSAKCQNPYIRLTNDDLIQVNLCGDSLETSDIVPATPNVSKIQSHFTLNKCNAYYYRPLVQILHSTKDLTGDVSLSKSLNYQRSQMPSIPLNSSSYRSSKGEEKSNACIEFDNKPYVLLRRMSLPECSKVIENCDTFMSSQSTSSCNDITSVSQNGAAVFNANPAFVRLERLPFDICKNIEHNVKPVVKLERFNSLANSHNKHNIKTNTTCSLISINDSSIITVNSSMNREVNPDCEQVSKMYISNVTVNATDILATPLCLRAKVEHESLPIRDRNEKCFALPTNSTPYSSHKSEQIHKIDLSDVAEDSSNSCRTDRKKDVECKGEFAAPKPRVLVKPGKSWRRSLAIVKRQSVLSPSGEKNEHSGHINSASSSVERKLSKRLSVKIVPITPLKSKPRESTILETYALCKSGYVPEQEPVVDDRLLDASIRSIRELSLNVPGPENQDSSLIEHSAPLLTLTARDVVLRRCGQTEPLSFRECYTSSCLEHCQKIGEGVYGEVFLYRNKNGGTTVMKVIPIEGSRIVNGERQKKFDEILSEIVIAVELSNLRNNENNRTTAFSEVIEVKCVQGCYPEKLLELWELYDEIRQSDNDSPEIFTEEQLYIILELANGGKDIEAFLFTNAVQAYSVFQQTACALAIAENELKFEHRDLHWGNILVSVVDRNKKLGFLLNGEEIQVGTKGVEVAIIDFTLSRIMYDGCVIFNDLAEDDDLFSAKGDYQFEIYRQMQKRNGNEWQHFEPYTNVLWLHYLLDKMVTALRYKNPQTKVHKEYIEKLKKIESEVLSYRSVEELVNKIFL